MVMTCGPRINYARTLAVTAGGRAVTAGWSAWNGSFARIAEQSPVVHFTAHRNAPP